MVLTYFQLQNKVAFMPRKLRLEYPGALYHIMNRGDRREDIFLDDKDRQLFLETLGQCCAKTDWQVHAYCLMPNHFHLVLETPQPNLVAGMKWFLGVYTTRFNRRHKLFGHLFSGRYKSLIVDGSGNGYLKTVCDYVHLNPVRAKMLKGNQPLKDYPWSSHGEYLKPPRQRMPWLSVQRLLGENGIPQDSAAGRREFGRRMELRRWEGQPEQWNKVRRGWCIGDNAFRKELLEQMSQRKGTWHYGEELRESAQEKAERLILAGLKRRKWTEQDLEKRRKGDPIKIKLAQELREETTMTLQWIAERLRMGTRGHLTHLLYWHKRNATVKTK
jgi:putative transposase